MMITLLLCAFIILLYYFLRYAKFVRLINKIPSKPALPVLGHTIEFMYSPEYLWKAQREMCENYYPIYKLWLGPIALVSVHHPDDLEKILTSSKEHLSKGYIYTSFYPWLGTGLLTSEGIAKNLTKLLLLANI